MARPSQGEQVDRVIDITEPETITLDPVPAQVEIGETSTARDTPGITRAITVLGLALALAAGAAAFGLTRDATAPDGSAVAILDAPVPQVDKEDGAGELVGQLEDPTTALAVPSGLIGRPIDDVAAVLVGAGFRVEQMAEVLDSAAGFSDEEVLSVHPVSGTEMQADGLVTLTYAVVPADESRTFAPEPAFTPSIGWAGNPAGSGCTPGPGSLPDGTWFGLVQGQAGGELSFDLICYDGTTGNYSNQNSLVRAVPLAGDLRVECVDGPCSLSAIDHARVTGVRIERGYATVLFNGVGL